MKVAVKIIQRCAPGAALCAILLAVVPLLWTQGDLGGAPEEAEAGLGGLPSEIAARYREIVWSRAAQRGAPRGLVEQKWPEYQESSAREWVDYDEEGDSMSRVDFEKGLVQLATLIPLDQAVPGRRGAAKFSELDREERRLLKQAALEKIAAHTKRILLRRADRRSEVLKDHIRNPEGGPLHAGISDNFVRAHLCQCLDVQEEPVIGGDGKARMLVSAEVEMVPGHLRLRAQRYAPYVNACAKKFKLDPALVFAVIHTESWFNPMAKSKVGALGLMQLMPGETAHEAYKYLFKGKGTPSREYVYDPENNILLGTAYLHMLHRSYGRYKSPENRRILSIAAYNCGPGTVRRRILARHDVDRLSDKELMRVIRKLTPAETQEYVPAVQKRIALYSTL